MKEFSRGLLDRLREFLALVKKDAALVTVLLRRFFSPPGLFWSSLVRRVKKPPGGEDFFWLTLASSVWMLKGGVSMAPERAMESVLSLGGLEEPLNILFSNPPWLEKLLRLFPASLMIVDG